MWSDYETSLYSPELPGFAQSYSQESIISWINQCEDYPFSSDSVTCPDSPTSIISADYSHFSTYPIGGYKSSLYPHTLCSSVNSDWSDLISFGEKQIDDWNNRQMEVLSTTEMSADLSYVDLQPMDNYTWGKSLEENHWSSSMHSNMEDQCLVGAKDIESVDYISTCDNSIGDIKDTHSFSIQKMESNRNSYTKLEAPCILVERFDFGFIPETISNSNENKDHTRNVCKQNTETKKRQFVKGNNDLTCANCATKVTSLWRKTSGGETVCNACGLFFKVHGRNRPTHMRKDSVLGRRRKSNTRKNQCQVKRE